MYSRQVNYDPKEMGNLVTAKKIRNSTNET